MHNLFFFSSRKRRGSETVSEEGGSSSEECSRKGFRLQAEAKMRGAEAWAEKKAERASSPIMSECTAAMVSYLFFGKIGPRQKKN